MSHVFTRTNSLPRNSVEPDTTCDLPAISVQNVTKRFGSFHALDRISFDIGARRFVSIVGPSGCGKSTLLNLIAGLNVPSEGKIEVFGHPLDGINTRASYMFQWDALLPWKTVLANIKFGLDLRGGDVGQARRKAEEWVRRIGLDSFVHYYPHQLSGGMRTRVASAQCWIAEPDLMLMDEPFSALDVHTRMRMEEEIQRLWSDCGTTVVFVTHDLDEAVALSDEVLLLSASPGSHLVGRYSIALPRPRNLIDIKSDSEFQDLYQSIWRDLRKEVLKVHDPIHG